MGFLIDRNSKFKIVIKSNPIGIIACTLLAWRCLQSNSKIDSWKGCSSRRTRQALRASEINWLARRNRGRKGTIVGTITSQRDYRKSIATQFREEGNKKGRILRLFYLRANQQFFSEIIIKIVWERKRRN